MEKLFQDFQLNVLIVFFFFFPNEESRTLKGIQSCVLRTILLWSLIYLIREYTSRYFLHIPLEN